MTKTAPAPASKARPTPPERSQTPEYQPAHLSHAARIHSDGRVDLNLRAYLPASFCARDSQAMQVKVGSGSWQGLTPPEPGTACWSLTLERVAPGAPLHFRYLDPSGTWQPLSPVCDLENVYGAIYVPKLTHRWQHQPPEYTHAKVLLETSLEGLLAGYKGGKFAPNGLEEMFQRSLSERIVETSIPPRLAAWAVDEIMVPICCSIADRANLNPKFNYLTFNIAELDWQIGRPSHFARLVDVLNQHGILLIPDLIFVHQVRQPFPGSMDSIHSKDGRQLNVDPDPYKFRDYGTWMFDLADRVVRRKIVEKVVALAKRYRLRTIRIDFVDGLILQYSQRNTENYGETLVRELKAELERVAPEVVVLGETFEAAGNPGVQALIDIFYSPAGFSVVEELYKPPEKMGRPLYPELDNFLGAIEGAAYSDRSEANYAQLHDEIWYDEQIILGRPQVPWAYGSNPAQLAKNRGEALVERGLLEPQMLLDFVRRTVRNAEALTMFCAKLKYMYTPGVDSLSLGGLDVPNLWRVTWEGVPPEQMQAWRKTELSAKDIFRLHDQHRADMIRLREIFRRYSKVEPQTRRPLVQPQIYHVNTSNSILGIFRMSQVSAHESLLILFNLGADSFRGNATYELPVPDGFFGLWEVLFDGDWIDPSRRLSQGDRPSYRPGTQIDTTSGQFLGNARVLKLNFGANSLLVLRFLG